MERYLLHLAYFFQTRQNSDQYLQNNYLRACPNLIAKTAGKINLPGLPYNLAP